MRCVIQTGLPECRIPYPEAFDKFVHMNEGNVKLVESLVGADCWAIRTRYKGQTEPIVECNTYALEGNYILNRSHPEYVPTINKVESSLFRKSIYLNPAGYLANSDIIEIFMFHPEYCWKVVLTRDQNDCFTREAFKSRQNMFEKSVSCSN